MMIDKEDEDSDDDDDDDADEAVWFCTAYMSETEAARRHDSSGPSDTESIGSDYGPSASRRLPGRAVYSEAEASDFEAPQRAADKTVRQSAMDALRRGPRRKPPTAVLVQPGWTSHAFRISAPNSGIYCLLASVILRHSLHFVGI